MQKLIVDLPRVVQGVLAEYSLPLDGYHGIAHWARVLENGMRLAAATGANLDVVALFAVLHDSQRVNEGRDPRHGPRAAEFARRRRAELFEIADDAFALLYAACEGHTHQRTHPDVTVQTCFDADRLDLGRVGVWPEPERLCTSAAKLRETIQWADGRAALGIVPELVLRDWGIDLSRTRQQRHLRQRQALQQQQ